MTCDTFVVCQAHSINQILQPVTGVIISSSAVLSNYFKRHFQGTKDVKYFKSQLYGNKCFHQYNVFKILLFFVLNSLNYTTCSATELLITNACILVSVITTLARIFLCFFLPVLPFSASCMYCVNTDFKFPGRSFLLCVLPAVLNLPSFGDLHTLIFGFNILYLRRAIVEVFDGK